MGSCRGRMSSNLRWGWGRWIQEVFDGNFVCCLEGAREGEKIRTHGTHVVYGEMIELWAALNLVVGDGIRGCCSSGAADSRALASELPKGLLRP